MPAEIPTHTPNKKEKIDDDARKFITETLESKFLEERDASSSTFTVDWLETGEVNERKVVHKKFDDGDVKIFLVAKTTENGNRIAEKERITEERYQQLKASSVSHLEKKRYEFEYMQNNTRFSVKYDEFADGKLTMLEVDASNVEERDSFSPDDFPAKLEEVTDDIRYYGYRVAEII